MECMSPKKYGTIENNYYLDGEQKGEGQNIIFTFSNPLNSKSSKQLDINWNPLMAPAIPLCKRIAAILCPECHKVTKRTNRGKIQVIKSIFRGNGVEAYKIKFHPVKNWCKQLQPFFDQIYLTRKLSLICRWYDDGKRHQKRAWKKKMSKKNISDKRAVSTPINIYLIKKTTIETLLFSVRLRLNIMKIILKLVFFTKRIIFFWNHCILKNRK